MKQFHSFHESFNNSMKLAIAAIGLAKAWSQTDADFSDQFRNAVKNVSIRWRRYCPRNFEDAADAARLDITRNGVVAVFAAFEGYLESLKPHAVERGGVRGRRRLAKVREPWRNDLAHHRVAGVGLDVPELESQRALLAFFREVRNCIVHQSTLADERLPKIANSHQLKSVIKILTARAGGRALPEVPIVRQGKPVQLEPEHAIMASSVCFELASAIDRRLVSTYGP